MVVFLICAIKMDGWLGFYGILSGCSRDNVCKLGIGEVRKVPRDNRRAALATGSSLERYDFLAESLTIDPIIKLFGTND